MGAQAPDITIRPQPSDAAVEEGADGIKNGTDAMDTGMAAGNPRKPTRMARHPMAGAPGGDGGEGNQPAVPTQALLSSCKAGSSCAIFVCAPFTAVSAPVSPSAAEDASSSWTTVSYGGHSTGRAQRLFKRPASRPASALASPVSSAQVGPT